MIESFPSVELADPESGLLAAGGDLDVESLILAYTSGIFPWPTPGEPLLWFAPDPRAILEFADLHVPKRLRQELRGVDWQLRVDSDFAGVIAACAEAPNRREGGAGTWITPEMQEAYLALHHAGIARCFSVYHEDQLIAGLYGVHIGHYFAAESMFYNVSGASKFALLSAVEWLQERGSTWIDIQMMSAHMQRFGAKEIPRKEFMQKLSLAVQG